ncbi:general secretion pathway protein GspH [Vibrio metoecus]|nr:general secretion pathway protein GspH [Vibrio metoecus]
MVESIESSLVSKPLKSSKSRCFNVVGCSTRSALFHKGLHHR